MKKLLAFLLAFMLLPMIAVAEEDAAESGTPITLTIGELVIPAVLNDTTAAQDLISRLPYTVTVSRGSVDFCGDIGEPLHHEDSDFQRGLQYGDIIWMPNGNWFVFFTDDIESRMDRDWLVLGHMDDVWEQTKELRGSVEVEISLREEQENIMLIKVTDGSNTVRYQLNGSSAAQSLYEQLPITVAVENYGSNEKIFYPPTSLDISDIVEGGGPEGTLAYFSPWGNVIMYYSPFGAYPGLYTLGEPIEGVDQIRNLSGTITVTAE